MNTKFGILRIALLGTGLVSTAPALADDPSAVRAACSALGLNPSEAPYIACVKTLTQSAQSQTYATMSPARATDAGSNRAAAPTGSTVEAACVAVGLDPATARYSYCVGNLKQVLFDQQDFLTR